MMFEFDPNKSHANQHKHGIDFETAQRLWSDPNRITFVARFQDEERHGIVGRLGDKLWCAIYTLRADNIRIISVRRAREYEQDLYFDSGRV